MGKADTFFDDDSNTAAVNLGVRTEGHTLAAIPAERLPSERGIKRDRDAKVILIGHIIAKQQLRTDFNEQELNELAHSLKILGQKTPILVYWSEADEHYVIIFGERRWRAAKLAGLKELSCKIHSHEPTEDELVELQFVENAIRSDLNPIEESLSYKKLQELKGYTTTQLAERIGKNQSTISRSLSLLRLPENIQALIAKGELPVTIAREVTKKKTEPEQQGMATRYLAGQLNRDQAQQETSKRSNGSGVSTKNSKKWTVNGVAINVSYSRGVTLADVAEALESKAAQLKADKRTQRSAA